MNEWVNSSWNVFVQVQPGADTALLNKNINELKRQHDPNDQDQHLLRFSDEQVAIIQ